MLVETTGVLGEVVLGVVVGHSMYDYVLLEG